MNKPSDSPKLPVFLMILASEVGRRSKEENVGECLPEGRCWRIQESLWTAWALFNGGRRCLCECVCVCECVVKVCVRVLLWACVCVYETLSQEGQTNPHHCMFLILIVPRSINVCPSRDPGLQ